MNENKFLKNTFLLAVASILSKLIGFVFRVPLTNMIGAEGIGLFNYGHTLYAALVSFIVAGVPLAMSKMIAERIADEKYDEAHRIFKLSFVGMFFIGLMMSLVLLVITDFFIGLIWPVETYFVLFGLVFAPFFIALSSAFKGYFIGLQENKAPALAQIIESLGRLIFGLGLTYILLSKMNHLAVVGAALGVTCGAFLGFISYAIDYLRIRKKLYFGVNQNIELSWKATNKDLLKELAQYAIPISIGALAGTLITLTDSIMIPGRLATIGIEENVITTLYGNISSVWMIVNLPLAALVALSSSWMPKMAELRTQNKSKEFLEYLKKNIKWTLYIVLPSTSGLFFLSKEILKLIFPSIIGAEHLLEILSLSLVLMGLNLIFITTLQGLGETRKPINHLLFGSIFKIILNYILIGIPILGIYGAAIATLLSYLLISILNALSILKKLDKPKISLIIFRDPIIATIIMIIVLLLNQKYLSLKNIGDNPKTILLILISGLFYIFIVFIQNKTWNSHSNNHS